MSDVNVFIGRIRIDGLNYDFKFIDPKHLSLRLVVDASPTTSAVSLIQTEWGSPVHIDKLRDSTVLRLTKDGYVERNCFIIPKDAEGDYAMAVMLEDIRDVIKTLDWYLDSMPTNDPSYENYEAIEGHLREARRATKLLLNSGRDL
mgnify:CR=1 FL=1